MAAAHSFGADAISPVHGSPQNGKVTDENDAPTMNKLINDGVDGIITDYLDRLREVMEQRGLKQPNSYKTPKKEK